MIRSHTLSPAPNPLHIITVSSIGREFSTASLLLNWRREMELMAIMNHLSCLFSAFPLNYSARRTVRLYKHYWHSTDIQTLLAQYCYTNTAGTVRIYKHCWHSTNMQTRPCVTLYKHGPVHTMHTPPCVHYAHTVVCNAIQTRPYAHYAHTALCKICTHGPVHTMQTRPCSRYAHTALCALCTHGSV